MEVLASEFDEADETIKELTAKGESLNAELNNLEREKSSSQAFVEESHSVITGRREERQALTLDIATLNAETQALEKEEESVKGGLKFAGVDGGSGLYTTPKDTFLPRLGFAYQLTSGKENLLRIGLLPPFPPERARSFSSRNR